MIKYIANILKVTFILSLLLIASGCGGGDSDPDPGPDPIDESLVTNVSLANNQELYVGQTVTMTGKGFESGDVLMFQMTGQLVEITILGATSGNVSYVVSDKFKSGLYTVTVKRGSKTQTLGTTRLKIVAQVPDKDGMNIKGKVYSGTTALKGVRVSDGIVTVETDANGCYWLSSQKTNGYVFVTLPSGYMPEGGTNVAPAFWVTLDGLVTSREQHDFVLTKVNNDQHIAMVATDFHVANRGTTVNDMNQFKNGFMTEADQFIKAQSMPVYTFVLGDMTWDLYWYSRSFGLDQYKKIMEPFAAPMFHIMGNHDNDPYIANDFLAESKYKEFFGPAYYSVNIGKIHYIMLDNSVYENAGGSTGTIGDREYKKYVTAAQLQWLKEDLASITDRTTPIVVGFHCQSTNNYNAAFVTTPKFSPSTETKVLHDCFLGFSDINFLSGHTHYMANMDITIGSARATEHNITAVCETWWWSGYLTPGLNVSTDGSPSGYKIFEMDNKNVEWYFKGIGTDKSTQFRAYDMNKVKAFFADAEVHQVLSKISGYSNEYASMPDNSLLLNVWDYDSDWTITAKESETGTNLTVKRKYAYDPLHRMCYDYLRTKKDNAVPGFLSEKNAHLFLIETTNATSTIVVTAQNRFGKTFAETITRPKAFTYSMQ